MAPIEDKGMNKYTIDKVISSKVVSKDTKYPFSLQIKSLISWDKYHIKIRNIFERMLCEICIQAGQDQTLKVVEIA